MSRLDGCIVDAEIALPRRQYVRATLGALFGLALSLSSGCKDTAPEAASVVESAADAASKAPVEQRATAVPAALQPGQRVQGTITLDIGHGPLTYRVIATKLADDLGKQAAGRLAGSEGKAALEKANARVGGKVEVKASDVQELADAFAGKTIYAAEVRTIDIVNRQQVSIEGEAADGSRVTLGFALPIGGDDVLDAFVEYRPDRRRAMENFKATSRDGAVRIVLERLQRDAAQTWSVSGTFDATNMQPGVLAKNLAGRSIGHAAGRFDVAELHVRTP